MKVGSICSLYREGTEDAKGKAEHPWLVLWETEAEKCCED